MKRAAIACLLLALLLCACCRAEPPVRGAAGLPGDSAARALLPLATGARAYGKFPKGVWLSPSTSGSQSRGAAEAAEEPQEDGEDIGEEDLWEDDPLYARDYMDPEDFYEDCWDEFEDYEDAEDYYYDHGGY